jgi:sn-glycerol 3-phosphate transport system ATP-binding protein
MNLITKAGRLIGIRPEQIRVSHEGQMARVNSVEHLGADSIILCELDGQAVLVRQEGFSKLRAGDTIGLAWMPTDEHQFDPATGQRLASATTEMKQFATG